MLSHEPKGKTKGNSRIVGSANDYGIRRKRSAMRRQALSIKAFPLVLAVAAIVLLSLSTPARADLLDTVLGILAPDYVEAKGVIACVIKQGTFNEAVAKACIEQQAKAQAKKLVPGDPKLKSIVDTVFAAKSGDWVRVVELLGTDGLKTVVCSGAVSVGGPVKDLVCGAAFQVAKPVIKPALHAVLKPDWWELVTLLGPGAACGVIPGGEVKDALCGVLGQAVAEVGKFVKGGVSAGKDVLISLGEDLSGQTQHMPTAEYYEDYWYPYLHLDVMIILRGGKFSHNVDYDHCVGYFDSHKASEAHAKEWCGKMRDQLAANVNATVSAIKAAPHPYFVATLNPQVPVQVIDHYKQIGTGFGGFAGTCAKDISKLIPIPGKVPTEKDLGAPPPYTATGWACKQAMVEFEKALEAHKQKVVDPLITKMKGWGCKATVGLDWQDPNRLQFECDSYEMRAQCSQSIDHPFTETYHRSHCGVNNFLASKKLAPQIAKTLGAKRCTVIQEGNFFSIRCTRPWKYEQCKTLLTDHTKGVSGVQAYCKQTDQLKNEPAFSVTAQQAQNILNTLNGVKKVGAVQQPGGKTQGLVMVPPVKVCTHGVDPLAITCPGNPKAPAEAGVKLPPCLPDPNKDGADTPCYAGPYSIASGANQPMVGAPQPGLVPAPPPAAPQPPGNQRQQRALPPRP